MRVAFLGPDGSFSSRAARALFAQATPVPQASLDDVLHAVVEGSAEAAALPLTNKLAGAVPGMLTKLQRAGRPIVQLVWLPVDLVLLGRPGAKAGDIREVRSHPVALKQAPPAGDIAAVPWSSTADAARSVADGDDASVAALGDRALSERLGLIVLAEPLAGVDNATLFAGVGATADDAPATALTMGPVEVAPTAPLVVDGDLALWVGDAVAGAARVGGCAWPIPRAR
jgi:prephenate dehydratase